MQTLRWPRPLAKRLTRPRHRHKVCLLDERGRASGIVEKDEVQCGWARPFTARIAGQGVRVQGCDIYGVYWHFSHPAGKRALLGFTQCEGIPISLPQEGKRDPRWRLQALQKGSNLVWGDPEGKSSRSRCIRAWGGAPFPQGSRTSRIVILV